VNPDESLVGAGVRVRAAVIGDAEEAAMLLRRSIAELCTADHQHDPATLERWLSNKTPEHLQRWIADPDNYVIVVEEAGVLLGVGLLHRSGEIRLCYMAPEAKGRGVGRAILQALEAQAAGWGIGTLALNSTIGARGFYEHMGFRSGGCATEGFGVTQCHPYVKELPAESCTNA
jgi:GNAT superfamily N-acetyltransferase